jgi:hypothetical protein
LDTADARNDSSSWDVIAVEAVAGKLRELQKWRARVDEGADPVADEHFVPLSVLLLQLLSTPLFHEGHEETRLTKFDLLDHCSKTLFERFHFAVVFLGDELCQEGGGSL